jgi:LPXTG-site transpeptidase (sortase) family protein
MNPLDRILHRLWERKVPFFLVFFAVVLITYAVLFAIDFIPEPVDGDNASDTSSSIIDEIKANLASQATATYEPEVLEPIVTSVFPTKIIFDSLDREVTVLNPDSREVADLDEALLEGVVRHPDSADFSEAGNIFILGHSSYLPNVFNSNFQAFNGIQELEWGDKIRLISDDTEYTYQVEKVYKAKASEVVVPHTPGKANLTLATCNSFGSKDDRYMVEANLVSKKPL